MTRPFFSRDRVTDFVHFEKYADKLMRIIDGHSAHSEPLDIQDLFSRFTMDVAGEFVRFPLLIDEPTVKETNQLFDTQFNTLDLQLPKAFESVLGPKGSAAPPSSSTTGAPANETELLLVAFEKAEDILKERGRRRMLWPLFEMWKDASDEPVKVINEFLRGVLARVLERRRMSLGDGVETKSDEEDSEEPSFIEYLAKSTQG
jgi:hypothetical protein